MNNYTEFYNLVQQILESQISTNQYKFVRLLITEEDGKDTFKVEVTTIAADSYAKVVNKYYSFVDENTIDHINSLAAVITTSKDNSVATYPQYHPEMFDFIINTNSNYFNDIEERLEDQHICKQIYDKCWDKDAQTLFNLLDYLFKSKEFKNNINQNANSLFDKNFLDELT